MSLSPAARRIIDLLAPYTPFAEAIVSRQAERARLSVETISMAEIRQISGNILAAAGVFVEPDVLDRLRRELERGTR